MTLINPNNQYEQLTQSHIPYELRAITQIIKLGHMNPLTNPLFMYKIGTTNLYDVLKATGTEPNDVKDMWGIQRHLIEIHGNDKVTRITTPVLRRDNSGLKIGVRQFIPNICLYTDTHYDIRFKVEPQSNATRGLNITAVKRSDSEKGPDEEHFKFRIEQTKLGYNKEDMQYSEYTTTCTANTTISQDQLVGCYRDNTTNLKLTQTLITTLTETGGTEFPLVDIEKDS